MLKVFRFEVNFIAGDFGEKVAGDKGGFFDNAFQIAGGLVNAGNGSCLYDFLIGDFRCFFFGHSSASCYICLHIM